MTGDGLRIAAGLSVAASIGLIATASLAASGADPDPRHVPADERTTPPLARTIPPPAPRCAADGMPPTSATKPGEMVLLVCEGGSGPHRPPPAVPSR